MLFFFASLYFLQGAAFAYVVNFQKPFLAGQGVDKATLGLFTSLLLLPFILKVFLGMLSDRRGGRKPYMLVGLALYAAGYAALAFLNPATQFPAFAAVTWMASLGLALFDTCADGWAIDVAEEREQSAVQAAMIAGKSLGLITMAFGFGWIAERYGYAFVFLTLSGLAALIAVVVASRRYRPRARAVVAAGPRWRDLLTPAYGAFALFGILYSIASFGTDGLLSLFLTEARGLAPSALGGFGVARGVGALLGAGAYVLATRKLSLARAQVLALVALGGGCLLPLTDLDGLALGLLWGLAWGFQETAFVTLAMRFAEGAWAATFFAIAMIFSNVGTALGEALAAPLVPAVGYGTVFSAFALVAWATLALVRWITPRGPAAS